MCCYYSVFLECFLSIIFWTFPPAHPSFGTHSCISFISAVHCCVSNLFAVEDSAELLSQICCREGQCSIADYLCSQYLICSSSIQACTLNLYHNFSAFVMHVHWGIFFFPIVLKWLLLAPLFLLFLLGVFQVAIFSK